MINKVLEKVFLGLLIVLCIISILVAYKHEKSEKMYCERVLYSEDFIDRGCDIYFKSEQWYLDYMKEVLENE